MTTYSTLFVCHKTLFVSYHELTVSGTVVVNGTPVCRTVVGYVYPRMSEPFFAYSDEDTGAFSLTLPCGPNTRLIVMVLGEAGEETKVYDWVTRP